METTTYEHVEPDVVEDDVGWRICVWGAWVFGPLPFALLVIAALLGPANARYLLLVVPLLAMTHFLAANATLWALFAGRRARRSPTTWLLLVYWLAIAASIVSIMSPAADPSEGHTWALIFGLTTFSAAIAMPLLGLARLALRR